MATITPNLKLTKNGISEKFSLATHNSNLDLIDASASPSVLLENIKKVDGTGSGLDADLLQGKGRKYYDINWYNDIPYSLNDVKSYNKALYVSLKENNLGILPTDKNAWEPVKTSSEVVVDSKLVSYNPSTSGLTSLNVQDAIDEVAGNNSGKAINISYENASSGLASKNVQAAIDELSAKPIPEGQKVYDVIIKTQADFDKLIASPTWLDAKSVLFIGGTLFTKSDGIGIKIPDNVYLIEGTSNIEIKIKDFVYNETTNKACFYYDSQSNSSFRTIRNITLSCVNTNSKNIIGFMNFSNMYSCKCKMYSTSNLCSYAFQNCRNLTRCQVPSDDTNKSYHFNLCDTLYCCVSTISKSTGDDGYDEFISYFSCTNLFGCESNWWLVNPAFFVSVSQYKECVRIDSCTAVITGVASTPNLGTYCFNKCTYITNSYASTTCDSNCVAFYNCNRLTNCGGWAECNGNSYSYAFFLCALLVNCEGTGKTKSSSMPGNSFMDCSWISNCRQTQGSASTTAFLGGSNTKVDPITVVAT